MKQRTPLFGLLAANAISITGNRLTQLAIPWFVLQSTGSVAQTGLVGFFSLLPFVISSALGGVIVDRLGYRRASIVSDVASGAAVLGVPILYHTVGLPLAALLALVFAGALLDAPGQTAREAMLPELLERAEMTLERGTSLFDGVSRGANMLGAPLAGVLIAVVGPTNVLVLDAATFAVSALLMFVFVPASAPRPSEGDAEGYFAQLREGYRFLWHTPLVRAIVIMVLVTNTLDAGMGGVLMPVYADRVLDSVVALGLMAGAMGLTAFAGTLVFAWIGHRAPRLSTLVIGFTLGGPVPLLPARGDAGDRACGDRLRDRGNRDRADQPDPRDARLRARPSGAPGPRLRRAFGRGHGGRTGRRPAGGGVRRARWPPGDADRLRRRLPRLHAQPARRAGLARRGTPANRPPSLRGKHRPGLRSSNASPNTSARAATAAGFTSSTATGRPSSRAIEVKAASSSPQAVIHSVNGAGSRSTLRA